MFAAGLAALAALVVLWLAWGPQPSDPGPTESPAPIESDPHLTLPEPATPGVVTVLAGDHEPTGTDSVPGMLEPRADAAHDGRRSRTRLAVLATTSDGSTLAEVLRTEHPGAGSLAAVALADPPGPLLPRTRLPAYRRFGLGSFRRVDELPVAERPGTAAGLVGVLELREPPPVHVALLLRHVVLASRLVEEADSPVAFVVEGGRLDEALGTVTLRVVEGRSGAPVAGATAAVEASFFTFTWTDRQRVVVSDAAGRVRVGHLLPGPMLLSLAAEGFGNRLVRIDVPVGAELEMGDVVLDPAVSASGRVLDAEGRPAAGAWLAVLPAQATHTSDWFVFCPPARTDAEGGFRLSPLSPDEYRLVASAEGPDGVMLLETLDLDLRPGDATGLEPRLERTAAVIVELDSPADTWRRFALVDSRGDPVARVDRDAAEGLPERRGDPDAPFTFHLAPGRYRLEVDWARGGRRQQTIDVGMDAMRVQVGR